MFLGSEGERRTGSAMVVLVISLLLRMFSWYLQAGSTEGLLGYLLPFWLPGPLGLCPLEWVSVVSCLVEPGKGHAGAYDQS